MYWDERPYDPRYCFVVERTGSHSVKIRKLASGQDQPYFGYPPSRAAATSVPVVPPNEPLLLRGFTDPAFGLAPRLNIEASDQPPPPKLGSHTDDPPPCRPPLLGKMNSLAGGGLGGVAGPVPSILGEIKWEKSLTGFFSNTSLDAYIKTEASKMATWQAKLILRIASYLKPKEKALYMMACRKFYTLLSSAGIGISKPSVLGLSGAIGDAPLPSLVMNPSSSLSKGNESTTLQVAKKDTFVFAAPGALSNPLDGPPPPMRPSFSISSTDSDLPPKSSPVLQTQHSLLGGGIKQQPRKLDLRQFTWSRR